MRRMVDAATTVVRLHRRLGFGLRSNQLTTDGTDVAAHADALLRDGTEKGAGAGSAADVVDDPWSDEDYTIEPGADVGGRRRLGLQAIGRWIDHMVATDRPLIDRMAWYWHGHFVSALDEVKNPQLMVDQMRLFRARGRGAFPELLRAVTIDAAMLLYLDGNDSTGEAPNENYSREVLELFTIGPGGYTEDDIAAGARALSGWRIIRGANAPQLVARRHDDSPRQYLGTGAVHDVDTVVDAIIAHPWLPTFVARGLAREVVGPAVTDEVIDRAAASFAAAGFDVVTLLRALADEVIAGADGGPIVSAPLPWYVAARRVTGAAPPLRDVLPHLQAAGQVPWLPPNVSGWPSGNAWNNASTLVARCNLAGLVAATTAADAPVLVADGPDDLAVVLGVASGWSTSTRSALDSVTTAHDRLVLALTSPEFVQS